MLLPLTHLSSLFLNSLPLIYGSTIGQPWFLNYNENDTESDIIGLRIKFQIERTLQNVDNLANLFNFLNYMALWSVGVECTVMVTVKPFLEHVRGTLNEN